MSSVFSAPVSPDEPPAEHKVMVQSLLQQEASEHRSRSWVSEREESRGMVMRVAAHTWAAKRSWKNRAATKALQCWVEWAGEQQKFVRHCSFPLWVWKRYADRKRMQQGAYLDLAVAFDTLRCRQVFRAWLRQKDHSQAVEKKWRGLLRERQLKSGLVALAAWHTWAAVQGATRRRIMDTMMRSQQAWMYAARFAQLRLYAYCRARRRERRQKFGQQLTLALPGAGGPLAIPALSFPSPLAGAAVDSAPLEAIAARYKQRDLEDLAACQWRFSHQGRRMFLAWHNFIQKLKKARSCWMGSLRRRAFKQLKYKTRWARTKRNADEEIEQKRRLDRSREGARAEEEDYFEELMLPSEKAARRKAKLGRAGTSAAAANRLSAEAEYREQRKAAEEAQAQAEEQAAKQRAKEEESDRDMRAQIAAIMAEDDGETLGDMLGGDDEEGAAAVLAEGAEEAAVQIQAAFRGHLGRLSLLPDDELELHHLRREIEKTNAAIARLQAKQVAMAEQWQAEEDQGEQKLSEAEKTRQHDEYEVAAASTSSEMRLLRRERKQLEQDIEFVLEGGLDDSASQDQSEEEPDDAVRRPSKYDSVCAEAAKSVQSGGAHLVQVRRRENRVAAEIERINEEQARLAKALAKRNSAFAEELAKLQARMQERMDAASSGENPLISMLEQLCDAFGIGLDAVARARQRNLSIKIFLKLAKPVQIRKARASWRRQLMRSHLDTLRRYTAMMRAIRQVAHVRFRCFYVVFRRWRKEARSQRIYRTRGLRFEVQCRRSLLVRFSTWLRDSPHSAYRCGRYALLSRWIEFVQRQVARRELCKLHKALQALWRRRQSFLAMFLGLKPQHQGAAMGYVEKNLLADVTLWQHCLRAEVGLLSDRHRRVNRREIQKRRDVGLATMTGRRRLQMAELELKRRVKHEHALSLEAFDDQVAWIPHWGTIFDKRSTEALAHFEAAKELVVQMQRMQHNPLHAEVKDVCASERVRVSLALWLMRARLNVDVRLTSLDAWELSKSVRRVVSRNAREAMDAQDSI